MPAKTEDLGTSKQNGIRESRNNDYPFIGLSDQNESEMKWIKLHQMFDR